MRPVMPCLSSGARQADALFAPAPQRGDKPGAGHAGALLIVRPWSPAEQASGSREVVA